MTWQIAQSLLDLISAAGAVEVITKREKMTNMHEYVRALIIELCCE